MRVITRDEWAVNYYQSLSGQNKRTARDPKSRNNCDRPYCRSVQNGRRVNAVQNFQVFNGGLTSNDDRARTNRRKNETNY